MHDEPMTIPMLAGLIGESLVRGPRLAFHQSETSIPPTWDDVRSAILYGYTAALNDVMDAILGDSHGLEAALADWGRLVMTEESLAQILSHLEKAEYGGEEAASAELGIYSFAY